MDLLPAGTLPMQGTLAEHRSFQFKFEFQSWYLIPFLINCNLTVVGNNFLNLTLTKTAIVSHATAFAASNVDDQPPRTRRRD